MSASSARRASGPHPEHGATFIEVTLVMTILALMVAIAVPGTAQAVDAARARLAAGFIASRVRLARQEAIFKTRQVGVVFDWRDGRWVFSVCLDGNRNGIRRADIGSGADPCSEGPHDIAQMFPGNRIDVDPTLPGPEGSDASADPVRFGPSDMLSFSPAGSCTPGTVFVRSKEGAQYAVRVGGATGRTRILRYDPGRSAWVAG
jgi:type II secretory pathway pseudopilin PulG